MLGPYFTCVYKTSSYTICNTFISPFPCSLASFVGSAFGFVNIYLKQCLEMRSIKSHCHGLFLFLF